MLLTQNAERLINIIENAGFEAYAVGGCVRDYIMNKPCDDIDIASSAKPEQLEAILSQNNIRYIETGLKHGTVTAVIDGEGYEITAFRSDGEYGDCRHPESVKFVSDIKEDLARRDFTVNAMAYSPENGIVDVFGGKSDIENRIIRTVGDPDKRFREDALRIMRALRFASVLSFDIDQDTEKSIFDNAELLKKVSAERIYTELSKLITGEGVFKILTEYKEVFGVILPELKPIFSVEQNTRWHIYDVWTHTAKAVEQSPYDLAIRYTMLFHDIGKAFAKTTDENGTDHFKGHQKISEKYAKTALARLKAPNEIVQRVMYLVPIHDMHIGTKPNKIKKWLSDANESRLRDLIAVKRADKAAQNPEMTAQELVNLDITERELNRIISDGEPFSLKDLAINGNDLIALGYSGKEIGTKLEYLLDAVINDKIENKKSKLLDYLSDCNN